MVSARTLACRAFVLTAVLLAAAGCKSDPPGRRTPPPQNLPPVANAGTDSTVPEGDTHQLIGIGTDADGTVVSYAWTQLPGGPQVALIDANQATASFIAPQVAADTPLTFRLTVTDDDGATDSDDVVVTVLNVPAPVPVVTVLSAQASEGNSGTTPMTFTVRLTGTVEGTVTVTYQTAPAATDTATVGVDYQSTSGQLQFQAAGDRTFTVNVIGDTTPEFDEFFTVSIASADATVSNSTALGVIRNDDPLANLCVQGANYLCAGAAKRSVTPTQEHINGVNEPRAGGSLGLPSTHLQKFNLGGFGVNLAQNLPDPLSAVPGFITNTAPAGERVFEGSLGPEHTYVRAFVVEQPGGELIAFVMLDAVGAGNVIQAGLKSAVVDATKFCGAEKNAACFTPDRIIFGQTHTHAGADLQGLWGGVPQKWIQDVLYTGAAQAVRDAFLARQPATLTLRQGQTVDFNNYRRPRIDPAIDADGTLTLLEARGFQSGAAIGSLLQYNAHPTSIGDGVNPRRPHADYIQGAMDWLESPGGLGGVSLYYNGPIADASPSGSRAGCNFSVNDRPGAPYGGVRCRGEGIADTALDFQERVLEPSVAFRSEEATLPITNPAFIAVAGLGGFNRYYDFLNLPLSEIPGIGGEVQNLPQLTPTATTQVSRITIGGAQGGLEIVTIPGETTNTFGKYIRSLAKTDVMLLGLTHNSFGYILPEEEFNYIDQTGDAGFLVPFTGYEESVSLGPLTAPLLRIQAYNPLFDVAPEGNLPPTVSACLVGGDANACLVTVLNNRVQLLLRGLEACRESGLTGNACPARESAGFLIGGFETFAEECSGNGGPPEFCGIFTAMAEGLEAALAGASTGDMTDDNLFAPALDAATRGCDLLDTAHCLLPFPSDHFTVAAPAGSPQAAPGATGRRINLNPLAMPRNAAGKPVDPTEWNRNDGFSPGQMIVTYVPNLAANPDGTIPGAPPITDIGRSLDVANSSVVVFDAETGEPHPVWAEIDLNAGMLLYIPARDFGGEDQVVSNPKPKQAALIIRPAVNFKEGRRYVVALKNLRNPLGQPIPAQAGFATCRDGESQLPPVQARCAQLEQKVFPVLDGRVPRDGSLYLAWDFTVASAENNVSRLRHMRDDAFKNYLGQTEDAAGRILSLGNAPAFAVTSIEENPNSELARVVRGTMIVPSYVVPAEPSPLDTNAQFQELVSQLPEELQDQINNGEVFPPSNASAPPNRLFYNPADAPNPADPQGSLYGDGLPDRTGEMTAKFRCNIPKAALSGKDFATATAGDVIPARPAIYGHGLLGSLEEVGSGPQRAMNGDHNFVYCAVDWFGFAEGDIPNVLTTTLDMSNFPVIPDGSQQGMVNQMFLARLLKHPQGFASNPAFRVGTAPVIDTREVFYDGNSQGGILAGPVVAMSKDITRGVFGVVGMNYSTLLTRSVDFDIFSVPVYLSYPDDLDRDLIFSLIQMLWDRSENNGYAHHLTDNSALKGPDNQILLHAAFADHQVTHWSAQVMARTIGVEVADMYPRKPGENATYTFADKFDFFAQRDPDTDAGAFWSLPLADRDEGVQYDTAPCFGQFCETPKSGYIEFDEGRTAIPPIGNVPPRADGFDPHSFPRNSKWGQCQKSHFLHTQGRIIDVRGIRDVTALSLCPDLPPPVGAPAGTGSQTVAPFYGSGLLGAIAQFFAELNNVITALLAGDLAGAAGELQTAFANFGGNLAALADSESPEDVIGTDPGTAIPQMLSANRDAEPVILTGDRLAAWSVPPAVGTPYPYPSGVGGDGEDITQGADDNLGTNFYVRDAHNGVILYPPSGSTLAPMGVDVSRIAAWRYENGTFVEVPVQVDQRFPYFLANARSGFSFYSGTDEELTYQWDVERWGDGDPEATTANYSGARQDPVTGLDHDDEIVFMARDAGFEPAGPGEQPADFDPAGGLQEIVLNDPLLDHETGQPNPPRFIYLGLKPHGSRSAYFGTRHYVNYDRDADADQWIDRHFFRPDDPEKLGSSNTGYGPNRTGKVQPGEAFYANPGACTGIGASRVCASTDRFPRDGVTVTTDAYLWRATGRWMVREVAVAKPDQPGVYGQDLVDRWKGRAFQQSPNDTIDAIGVGFEDEQVNWEANSTLLGERCGPVRCMREVWGADSGTNVTKTETFYRDAVAYRYHVRVHPIPPDGLYTSWDYNRGAMVPTDAERQAGVEGGRYFTALRPQGVPVDGINDDVGQMDGFMPIMTPDGPMCPTLGGAEGGEPFVPPNEFGRCPLFFDTADATFNLPLAFDNWEQVSGKGDSGSLVYLFEMKGPTSLFSPLVVPYYRDDACLDDATGDDPVQRPWPGERPDDPRVIAAYSAAAGKPYDQLSCEEKQGAYASHGVHYFFTGDTDNNFLLGKPNSEVDGQQWQFMVPTASPRNVGEPYANIVRAPLQAVVIPRPGVPANVPPQDNSGGLAAAFAAFASDLEAVLNAFMGADLLGALDALRVALFNLGEALQSLLYENGANGSATGTLGQIAGAESVGEAAGSTYNSAGELLFGAELGPGFKAGVGVVDMTPNVGFGAGQYSDKSPDTPDGEVDPYATHKAQKKSYGVQSRPTARAIVIEGSNGKRIALLKSDNYLAQDLLIRRVGQILEQGRSGISYEQILYGVSHAHSTSYSSTLSWGVWLFQDAYDARFFEFQARKLAEAIETAARNLQPARMGGTQIRHRIFKGNVVRPSRADDGTPAGYPHEYGDVDVAVLRFENLDGEPIAVYANHGQHPEGTDGMDLHSADYLAPLERFVEQEIGAPLVFSQGDVGSAENSANTNQRIADDHSVCGTRGDASGCPFGQGVVRDWQHTEFVAMERGARFLADDVVRAWYSFDGDTDPRTPEPVVPLTRDHAVEYLTYWVPGPLSHPYPSVSNCRTESTVGGNTGLPILGLPDCERTGFPGDNPFSQQFTLIYNTMKQEGIPVPEHYDAPAFTAVEENLRLMLQAFKIGDVLLASCACEVQNDLVLNLESRTNDRVLHPVTGKPDIYDGFDWACLMDGFKDDPGPNGDWAAACVQQRDYFVPGDFSNGFAFGGGVTFPADPALIARMRHQVHNDAAGWDAPENALNAPGEPADPTQIKGNFTKQQIQDFGVPGFKLPIAVGHAGDYNGYTVSYREYMNRDHYRKALTSHGPHTADYMATRLTQMAAILQGASSLALIPEVHEPAAVADELRQEALARAHGLATSNAYETWNAALSDDLGPVGPLAQPSPIRRFGAATFRWRGGSTATDNPLVRVQREYAPGLWLDEYGMSGEVQTRVHWPLGQDLPLVYAGQFSWEWTANFEAYTAFPARLGGTAPGNYRFCVNGASRKNRAELPYAFCSQAFAVQPWNGLSVTNAAVSGAGDVSFQVPAIVYPRTVAGGPFDEFYEDNGDPNLCRRCSFRPWAQFGRLERAEVVVTRAGGGTATVAASCGTGVPAVCHASAGLAAGDTAVIRVFDQDGNFGQAGVP